MTGSNDHKLDKAIALLEQYIEELERNKDYQTQHAKEHEFLRKIMEEYDRRIEFWQSVNKKVVSGAIWSLLVAIATAVLFSAKSYFTGSI